MKNITDLKPGEINAGQANRFVQRLKLQNLRIVNGEWWADDVYPPDAEAGIPDGATEPYRISPETYWTTWHEGDLIERGTGSGDRGLIEKRIIQFLESTQAEILVRVAAELCEGCTTGTLLEIEKRYLGDAN